MNMLSSPFATVPLRVFFYIVLTGSGSIAKDGPPGNSSYRLRLIHPKGFGLGSRRPGRPSPSPTSPHRHRHLWPPGLGVLASHLIAHGTEAKDPGSCISQRLLRVGRRVFLPYTQKVEHRGESLKEHYLSAGCPKKEIK